MTDSMQVMQNGVIQGMSEGVMTVSLKGIITLCNPAACRILAIPREQLEGRPFSECFFTHEENDAFTEAVLQAIYDTGSAHDNLVPYFTGQKTIQLHIRTSIEHTEGQRVGIIVVFSDVSELVELRDALKAMERIRALNAQLSIRNELLAETFGRYVSDELVKELLETPGGLTLGGKKAELTVMMSDLRGFTAMCERMEPQALVTMLNHYLGAMTEIIQQYRGTIIEFIGDGIMAIFGAPAFFDNHAECAVAAALQMQAAMPEINRWNEENGYPKLEMGIGLNTGEMIVGNIGSRKRTKYGVTGSEVNLCGRIESYTVGGQVLISPTTRAQVKAALGVVAERTVLPKGVTKPITIAQVESIGAPYAVAYHPTSEPPRPLAAPLPVEFLPMEEKHVGSGALQGSLTALSRDAACLTTAVPLRPYQNLQLLIGDKLLVKVVEVNGQNALLRFTARPAVFEAWLKEQRF